MKVIRQCAVVFALSAILLMGYASAAHAALLRIEEGRLIVDTQTGVDIKLTCGQWCTSDLAHSRLYLHQGSSWTTHDRDIRAFGNWELGTTYQFVYFPKDTEIVLEVQDFTTQARFFTGPASRNPDNRVHALITPVEGSPDSYLVRFEHSPCGGDNTYTDTQFTLAVTPARTATPVDPSKVTLGLNIAKNHYYTTQFLFNDAMKTAMPWVTGNNTWIPGGKNLWDTGVISQIPCDAEGYPLKLPYEVPGCEAPQRITTLLFRNGARYPTGTYTLLYDGEGDVAVGLNTANGKVISKEPGKIVFDVYTPDETGVMIRIGTSVEGNHVRNMRMIMPGGAEAFGQGTFNPLFLSRFNGVKTLRFMDLGQTNNNPLVTWAERPTRTSYTQGSDKGVALEYMIDLANQLGSNAWFCVPHKADDEYVRNMATMIRDTMPADRKVYIEYSNEVWNGMFAQARYTKDMGCYLGLCGPCTGTSNDNSQQFSNGVCYYAMRSAQIFKIFEEVFGNDPRLVKVIASQTASPGVVYFTLQKFHDPVINPDHVKASALALTGYFGMQADDIIKNNELSTITVDEVITRSRQSLNQTIFYLAEDKKLADNYGLPVIAYEGGQHLVSGAYQNNTELTNLLIAANRAPGMEELYYQLWDAWFAYGGNEFMVFESMAPPGKTGCWGVLESLDQPVETAPKYRALMSYIARHNPAPPVANAGANQTVHVGSTVTLDGAGSSDPNNKYPLSYAWSFETLCPGSAPLLSDPTSPSPTFVPGLEGDYTLKLVVTNSSGVQSAPAYIVVSTYNSEPIAEAGEDKAVTVVGSSVTLDGTQSYDPDGDAFTFSWGVDTAPSGSSAAVSQADTGIPSFSPDVYGNYTLYLMITDEWGSVGVDHVTVSFDNITPVANAGNSQALVLGEKAVLDGFASRDANGDPLTASWSIVSAPEGSTAVITSPASMEGTFTPDLPGTYILSLVVNDGLLNSEPSNITFSVVSVATAATNALQEAIENINFWGAEVFVNKNMANTLTNKLNAIITKVAAGKSGYAEAIDALRNDVLKKTDGCSVQNAPDKNDWIKNCTAQAELCPILLKAITILNNGLAQ